MKGIGKEKFSKTLVVNHKEEKRRVDDTLFLDDANIEPFEDTQLWIWIDNQAGKTLRVLYDTVYKKKGIVQTIAMNLKEFL